MQSLSLTNTGTTTFDDATLYFRVVNAEGSVATANVNVIYAPMP